MDKNINFLVRIASNLMTDDCYDTEKGWEKVRRRSVMKSKRFRLSLVLRYAVCLILLVSVVSYFIWNPKQAEQRPEPLLYRGSPKVKLNLANGECITLEQQSEVEVKDSGIYITRDSVSSQIEYRNESQGEEEQSEIQYNSLHVPKGADVNMKLPDGSVVTLNSESTLWFPVKFAKGTREVYLEGEAFFDVERDETAPFTVYIGDKSVTVLGTKFDVCAYPDDPIWTTTLVEGKVAVKFNDNEHVLTPSEQWALDTRDGTFELKKVDTDLYTSWIDGKFHFKGYRFEDIMEKMERWYDFEILYEDDEIKEMKFRGTIDKFRPLETMLRYIEETTNYIRFDIQCKIVKVRKIKDKIKGMNFVDSHSPI